MHQFLANSYVVTLPFIFAFTAGGGRLTPTIAVSAAMMIAMMADVGRKRVLPRQARMVLLASLPLLLYVLVNPLLTDSFGAKSVMHYLSYCASLVLFYIVPALFLSLYSPWISVDGVLKVLTASLVLTAGYALLQFSMRNLFELNIEAYLPFPSGIEADSMFLGRFYRARGFAPEPGHFALYLEMSIPFMAFYFTRGGQRHSWAVKLFCFFIVGLAVIATASPVPLFLLTSVFFVVALAVRPRLRAVGWIGIAAMLAIGVGIGYVIDSTLQGVVSFREMAWQFAFDKIGSYSADDRASRLDTAVTVFSQFGPVGHLFGGGAAIADKLGLGGDQTIFLLYPLIVTELGLVGLMLFGALLFWFSMSARSLPGVGRRMWWWGFLTMLLHYAIVANYWYPYLWFFGVFPMLFSREHLAGSNRESA